MNNDLEDMLIDDSIWTTVDHGASKEELQHTITQSIVATLKITHPDDMHLYVLEKVLNPVGDENENKVWQQVLKHLQEEK
jgi:hypothetical protein